MRKSFVTKVVFGFSVVMGMLTSVPDSFATTVNVDFNSLYLADGINSAGTYNSTAVAPDGGVFWNGWAPPSASIPSVDPNVTSQVLLNSNGATVGPWFGTNVQVTLNGNNWNSVDFSTPLPSQAPALMNDILYNQSTTTVVTFTISGLVSGATYDLYLYSQNGWHYSANSAFTINGSAPQNVPNGGAAFSGFVDGQNYTTFLGVVAAGGSIIGTMLALDGNGSGINGFQLVGIPEPSSLILLATGMLGMLAVRRRKR